MSIVTELYSDYKGLIEKNISKGKDYTRDLIRKELENIDAAIFNSRSKVRFKVKDIQERTIITLAGPVTFKRRRYHDTLEKGYVYLLDHQITLEKYQRIDGPTVMEIAKKAANYSYYEVANEILPDLGITPMTVCNCTKKVEITCTIKKAQKTPNIIYIQIDEKYTNSGKVKGQKKPHYSAVIFEGIDKTNPKRSKLINRHMLFSLTVKELREKVSHYMRNRYDISKIDICYIYGDGARYIANFAEYLDFLKCEFIHDKFHIMHLYNTFFRKLVQSEDKNGVLIIRKHCYHFDDIKDSIISGEIFKTIDQKCLEFEKNSSQYKALRKLRRKLAKLKNSSIFQSDYVGSSMEGYISHYSTKRLDNYPLKMARNLEKILRLKEARYNTETATYSFGWKSPYEEHLVLVEELDCYCARNISNMPVLSSKNTTLTKILSGIAHPSLF